MLEQRRGVGGLGGARILALLRGRVSVFHVLKEEN